MKSTHREGFICPVCRFRYDSDEQLMTHFEVSHGSKMTEMADDGGVGGIVKKFQQKLFNKTDSTDHVIEEPTVDDDDVEESGDQTSLQAVFQRQSKFAQQYATALAMSRSDGRCRSRFEEFINQRRDCLDRLVIETNKLLFRLEKLLAIQRDIDPQKRMKLEQEIVPWIGDKDMPICPICGSRFSKLNFNKRRHHCRLCGSLVCASCSIFLDGEAASTLVELAQCTNRMY